MGDVEVYLDNNTATPTTRVSGITSIVSGNTTTYTIPCQSLTIGNTYVIEIPRGSAGTDEYTVELRQESSVGTPILSGPSAVCTSNTTFALSNVPANTSISWARSSNLIYVSGQGAINYVVKPALGASGAGWVRVRYNTPCGESKTFTKNILIGKPNFTLNYQPYNNYVNMSIVGIGSSLDNQGITGIQWTKLGGTGYLSASNGTTGVAHGDGYNWYINVRVTLRNACGTTVKDFTINPPAPEPCPEPYTVYGSNDTGEYGIQKVAPEPPCLQYTSTQSKEKEASTIEMKVEGVELFTYYGRPVLKWATTETAWRFKGVAPGVYVLKVKVDNKMVISRITL